MLPSYPCLGHPTHRFGYIIGSFPTNSSTSSWTSSLCSHSPVVGFLPLLWLPHTHRFGYYIGSFPDEQLNLLLDLLFDPNTGLGLNIVRYNIGGGYNPSISTQFNNPTDPYRFRGMPGFKPDKDAPYNWTSDAEQRKVLLGARDRGVDTFLAFSNSPPWWMTISGTIQHSTLLQYCHCVAVSLCRFRAVLLGARDRGADTPPPCQTLSPEPCPLLNPESSPSAPAGDVAGSSSRTKCNLRPDSFKAFAEYLTDVVQQYKTDPAWNVNFQYLEPFNEPLEGFWVKGKKHEGCYFNPRQISTLIGHVQSSLKKKKLSTVLVGIDSASGQTNTGLKYMSPAARNTLQSIHVHGYVYGNAADHAVAVTRAYVPTSNAAKAVGKRIWQSEWGPVGCIGEDFDVALCMARHVMASVYLLNARAWCFWQAIDLYPFWSLINIPWAVGEEFSYSFSKKYFIMKQFSRGVPPGSTILSIPGGEACKHSVAAFYDKKGSRLVLFLLNELRTNQTITLNIDGFTPTLTARPSIRPFVTTTTAGEDYSVVDLKRRMTLTSFTHTLPARSLTRVAFLNVAMAKS